MSAGGPDLFVVCKSCGSEVSPYITECPYCGSRLRKRAPKIDRNGQVTEKRRRRRPGKPSLPPLKRGEMPGIRPDSRPYGTIVLLALGFAGTLLYRAAVVGSTHAVALWAANGTHLWWRLSVATFTYINTGHAALVLGTIGIFGWLLERRHGPWPVLLLFLLGGTGGTALAIAVDGHSLWLGASGAALAMVIAWAIPDLLDLRAGEEIEGDMIGAAVIATVLALLPLALYEVSWMTDVAGVLAGLLVGFPLARLSRR